MHSSIRSNKPKKTQSYAEFHFLCPSLLPWQIGWVAKEPRRMEQPLQKTHVKLNFRHRLFSSRHCSESAPWGSIGNAETDHSQVRRKSVLWPTKKIKGKIFDKTHSMRNSSVTVSWVYFNERRVDRKFHWKRVHSDLVLRNFIWIIKECNHITPK